MKIGLILFFGLINIINCNGQIKRINLYDSVIHIYSKSVNEFLLNQEYLEDGKWEILNKYDSNIILLEANYKNGVRNGDFIIRNYEGEMILQEIYTNGYKDGRSLIFYNNNRIQEEKIFNKGLLNGKVTTWYENGNLKSEKYYLNSKEIGIWKFWYENGQKEKEGYWGDSNYIDSIYKNGFFKDVFLYKGLVSIEEKFIEVLNENWTRVWYSNGNKKEDCILTDSIGTLKIYWYENGQKESEGYFSNNRYHNLWRYYDEKGNLIKEEIYNKGEFIDKKEYDDKGKLIYKK